jgi:hypothetical protein
LVAKVLVNWRGFHCLTHAPEGFIGVRSVDGGLRLQALAEAPPFYLRSTEAGVEPAHTWYRKYDLMSLTGNFRKVSDDE